MKIDSLQKLLVYSKKLSLLYVEDEFATRGRFTEIFEKLFDVVHTAKDAHEGLNLFSKNNIDIVITDIEMPVMNGLEMSRSIREQDFDIPIIVMTAHIDNSFVIKSIEIGVDAYLIKPIEEKTYLTH